MRPHQLKRTWPLALATAALLAACGSSARRPGANTPSLHVLSSITDGAMLADPVRWTAQPIGVRPGDSVARVEFSVDGRILWTEHKAPYSFNDDNNQLFPWLLGAGAHRLTIRLITTSGQTASTTAQITVMATRQVKALHGTYTRSITTADINRTQRFRNEPADQALPAGAWRLHISRSVFFFDDPQGGGGTEAFTARPDGTLAMQGPANWLEPPSRQGSFCGIEPRGTYRWAVHGNALTLTARSDRCADRNSLFNGTWTRA